MPDRGATDALRRGPPATIVVRDVDERNSRLRVSDGTG
jgi:hypothetical protein